MDVRSRRSHLQSLQEQKEKSSSERVDSTSLGGNVRKGRLGCCLRVLIILLVVYMIPPLVVRYSVWVQQAFIYVHHIKTPYYGNISNPGEYGLTKARNFELFHKDGCSVPTWQILPRPYHAQAVELRSDFERSLSDGLPIVLYLHGNTGTRATYHRVQLYKYLTEKRDYHVITFDYRGFAESQCHPSEKGMMEDGYLVWNWVKAHAPKSKLYVWGHSLGSAAATYLTKELCKSGSPPDGLVLDAPFTDIIETATHHPFSLPYRPVMTLFQYFVLDTFQERFESASRLQHITCPMLILHGHNDIIVPYHLGRKVYEIAVRSKTQFPSMGDVGFVDCGNTTHKNNYASLHIGQALDKFITN